VAEPQEEDTRGCRAGAGAYGGSSDAGSKRRTVRPRTVIYGGLMTALSAAAVVLVVGRVPFEATVVALIVVVLVNLAFIVIAVNGADEVDPAYVASER
jgi:hypothetical protein